MSEQSDDHPLVLGPLTSDQTGAPLSSSQAFVPTLPDFNATNRDSSSAVRRHQIESKGQGKEKTRCASTIRSLSLSPFSYSSSYSSLLLCRGETDRMKERMQSDVYEYILF